MWGVWFEFCSAFFFMGANSTQCVVLDAGKFVNACFGVVYHYSKTSTIVEVTVRYYPNLAHYATPDAPKFVNVPPCNKIKLW